MEPQDPTPLVRLLVIETPIPGVLLGHVPLLLPEPTDREVGWTTTDDTGW